MTEPSDLQFEGAKELADELADFESEQRRALGLPAEKEQWRDDLPSTFTREDRAHTTILICGLTMAHDLFIQAALRGLGYNIKALDVPDNDALQYGREFGNRGQCNPTYFTVGNLVKHLHELEKEGKTKQEIVDSNVFVTAGACGPCRFGTYVTEYRKALRDSGFEGFRVLLFQQTGGLKQATGEDLGLEMNPAFFQEIIKSVLVGDVLNALMYRIRPYEVEPGATDRAVAAAKDQITNAFENRTSVLRALWRSRKLLAAVEVDRTRVAPRVGVIGEFWAMTTEGDGNYAMQRFLESEGAEVDIQLITAWLLYMIWQGQHDTRARAELRGTDGQSKFGLAGVNIRKRLLILAIADRGLRFGFQLVAKLMGLRDYPLPDMNEVAEVSRAFYDLNLRGGEGHMEVGKLILNVMKSKVNMTLSIKPFGCMPSSAVSDGVQSLVTELHPEAIFLAVETSGDGAVNVYSRVQMQLFKARQQAEREVRQALDAARLSIEEVRECLKRHPRLARALHRSPHAYGCTLADLIAEIGGRRSTLGRLRALWRERPGSAIQTQQLVRAAKVAAETARAKTKSNAATELLVVQSRI